MSKFMCSYIIASAAYLLFPSEALLPSIKTPLCRTKPSIAGQSNLFDYNVAHRDRVGQACTEAFPAMTIKYVTEFINKSTEHLNILRFTSFYLAPLSDLQAPLSFSNDFLPWCLQRPL